MEHISTETKKEKKKMPLCKPSAKVSFYGKDLIDYLLQTLDIKFTLLAGILDVTEKTLRNWFELSYNEDGNAIAATKFKRLVNLYNFVSMAEKKDVPKHQIFTLLREQIEVDNENSSTILHYIVYDPDNQLLSVVSEQIIEKWLKE